jgi:hypothetical protein
MTTASDLYSQIQLYKFNPSAIQSAILDVSPNDIVDASNPFVFLLESSVINTSVAIQENLINARRVYPSLSQTEKDLYHHMSDKDYIGRFATADKAIWQIGISTSELLSKLELDSIENCYKAVIPRDTTFMVDNVTFTLQYPINIKRFVNGVIEFSYDVSHISPLETISSIIIPYEVRRDASMLEWLFIKIPILQMEIESHQDNLTSSTSYTNTISYNDSFLYARVFYKNNRTNNLWVEAYTTHSDLVYDAFKPTACLQVLETENTTGGTLTVTIPNIYASNGSMIGDIRVDVYTTKGSISLNLSNYLVAGFSYSLRALDEARDLNNFTTAAGQINFLAYSTDLTHGGSSKITFTELRDKVLTNTIGARQIPISSIHLSSDLSDKGYDAITHVDVITDRIILASRHLPNPSNTKLLTSANIGINTISATEADYTNTSRIVSNYNRFTLKSNNIFLNRNGVLSLVDRSQLEAKSVKDLVGVLNSSRYLYNPFYYVFDNSNDDFVIRAYHLDKPVIKNLSSDFQNETLQLPVSTGSYDMVKTETGYKITIVTASGSLYKNIQDSLVNVQLAFQPINETNHAYINGVLVGRATNNERIYEFNIETNHDIDNNDNIVITNASMFASQSVTFKTSLNTNFNFFYTTSSLPIGFRGSSEDALIGAFSLPNNSKCISKETVNVTLGYALSGLWARARASSSEPIYLRHTEDVPLLWSEDQYQTDANGSTVLINNGVPSFNILHHKNDPVLDTNGNPTYLYKKGDIVLDVNQQPIIDHVVSNNLIADLLLVDARYYFATDSVFTDYRNTITDILTNWITEDLVDIQDRTLDETRILFYPKTTIGEVAVKVDAVTQDTISTEQTFKIDMYVSNKIYRDETIRSSLQSTITSIIDTYIGRSTINLSELHDKVRAATINTIESLKISGLGGDKNYQIVSLIDPTSRLCIKKKLSIQGDDTTIVVEDINFNFINLESI